jgi:AraC-like DNA-binding protein
MEFKIFLVVLFVLTGFTAFLHFAKTPRNDSNVYLGIFIGFFSLSILHTFNVQSFYRTPYNPVVLLPLNLIFIPFYFLMRYFDKFLSAPVFDARIERLILVIGFIELSTHFLPLGAWLYTRTFDNPLISFLFLIKRVFVILLMPLGLWILYRLHQSLGRYTSTHPDDQIRIGWVRRCILLLSMLILVIVLPEIAYFLQARSFVLFLLQGLVGAGIVIYIGLQNLKIQIQSSIETAKETNLYNPATNRNFELIRKLLQEEKSYVNPNLRISDLAEKVSLSPNYVSKIINEQAKMGFNDFINQYRIEEVIEKLNQQAHREKNIFALAQEAGFKSKSTFQTSFKKWTQKTPTQYIQEIEIQQSKS